METFICYLFISHTCNGYTHVNPIYFAKSVLIVQCAKFHMIKFYHKAKVEVPELFMLDK